VVVVDYTDSYGDVHVMEQNNSRTGTAIYRLRNGLLTGDGDSRTVAATAKFSAEGAELQALSVLRKHRALPSAFGWRDSVIATE
jgi:hypothetical protein